MGIECVRRWLKLQLDGRPKLYFSTHCPILTSQIEQLRFADHREGKNQPEKQHDYNDHGPDALRYFFNEHFITRAGVGSLTKVYAGRGNTEAATFFQNRSKITHGVERL